MAKSLHEYDFHRTAMRVPPEDIDWDAELYLGEHFLELNALEALRVVTISIVKDAGFLEVRGDDGYVYPKGMSAVATANLLMGFRSKSGRLTRTGRLERRAVKTLADEMRATGRIKVRMLPGRLDESESAGDVEDEAGFARSRICGYRAGIRVERYRAAAEELQSEDPDTFWRIVARADGSDAVGAARRDPVAYVALFMAAADDAGVGPSE